MSDVYKFGDQVIVTQHIRKITNKKLNELYEEVGVCMSKNQHYDLLDHDIRGIKITLDDTFIETVIECPALVIDYQFDFNCYHIHSVGSHVFKKADHNQYKTHKKWLDESYIGKDFVDIVFYMPTFISGADLRNHDLTPFGYVKHLRSHVYKLQGQL